MRDDETRHRTAVHEAGHCLFAVLMGRRISFATVEPAGDTLGRTVFAERTAINLRDHRQVERAAGLHLSGFAAEMILDPRSVPTGCRDEVMYAYQLATEIGHGRRGFQQLVWRTTRMLLTVLPCVVSIATELHRRGTLDGGAVRRLAQRELGLRRR